MPEKQETAKLRANFVVLALAVAELIIILAYFLPKFIEINKQSNQLEQDIKCVDCCQSLAFKPEGNCDAECGNDSCTNWSFGFLDRDRKRSYKEEHLKKAVWTVMKEESNTDWGSLVRNNARHEKKVKRQISKIERNVLNGNRSYAHLTCDGQPKHSNQTGKNAIPQWEYRESAGFAMTSGNISFSRDTGEITVLDSGVYIIYIHSTFAPTWDDGNGYKERKCCSIIYTSGSHHKRHANHVKCSITKPEVKVAHEVLKLNKDHPEPKTLMRATDFIDPTVEFNQCHHRIEGITPIGIDCLDTIGTFKLVKGDKLIVNYDFPPDQIMLGSHEAETYFGLYQM